MDKTVLQEIKAWFDSYAREFAGANGKLPPMMRLKVDHTLRVVAECRGIAKELGWSEADVRTAEAIGWLHDAGRFSQLAEFGHFSDAQSINHAQRSWQVVEHSGILSRCAPGLRAILRAAVLAHNGHAVPDGLDADELRFSKLIRDADKIDIWFIADQARRSGLFRKHPELVLHIDLDGPANPELVEIFRQERVGSYGKVHSLADMGLTQLSWIFDIHYVPTFRRIRRRRIIEKIAEFLPDLDFVRESLGRSVAFVERRSRSAGV